MCGIAGVIGVGDPSVIKRMTGALDHRGPDQKAVVSASRFHIGVTRLSIVDQEAGAQPFFDEKRRTCVVFNGEIYNHDALREVLARRGHEFRTRSDTEVLLHAFEEWGIDCPKHLSGMYAFAIFDGSHIYLARDALGIKPLYYAYLERAHVFLFASEMKALFASKLICPLIRQQAVTDRAVLGYLIDQETYFEGIKSVSPGQVVKLGLTDTGISADVVRRFAHPKASTALSFDDAVDQCDSLLSDAVRTHLRADVPVGLALSGGIDSNLLAFYMKRHNPNGALQFLTIGDSEDHPDVLAAGRMARAIGTAHKTCIPTLEDALSVMPGCVLAAERPCSIKSSLSFLLFRGMSQFYKVCLIGEGADELFGGYPRAFTQPEIWVQGLLSRFRQVSAAGFKPSARVEALVHRAAQKVAKSPNDYLEMIFELNLTDQLTGRHLELIDCFSMASGVEARVPYLADRLVGFAKGLPSEFKVEWKTRSRKRILYALAERRLPRDVFAALPAKKWALPDAGSRHHTMFTETIETFATAYKREHAFRGPATGLLSHDLFEEIFVRRHGEIEAGFDVVEFFAQKMKVPSRGLRERLKIAAPTVREQVYAS